VKFVVLILKGMVVGIANVIPGVSAGTFMVLVGIYNQLIEAVGNFLSDREGLKSRLLFLFPLGVGVVVGTLAFAKLATFVLDRYPVPAQFFFIGLIAGGVPSVINMYHDMKVSLGRAIAFLVGLGLAILVGLAGRGQVTGDSAIEASSLQGLIYFGVVGFFAGGAVMTPGMSGSYIFLLAGTYEPIMQALDSLTQPPVHWGVIVSVAVGAGLGVLLFSKLIGLILKRRPAVTFYAILGLVCGSFVGLWPVEPDVSGLLVLGMPTLIVGFVFVYLLGWISGRGRPA